MNAAYDALFTIVLLALGVLAFASLASRDRPLRDKLAARPLPQRWAVYLLGLAAVVMYLFLR